MLSTAVCCTLCFLLDLLLEMLEQMVPDPAELLIAEEVTVLPDAGELLQLDLGPGLGRGGRAALQ